MSAPRLVARASAGVARLFYRLQIEGERPPATGPLLLVANHPNALLDTALVTLATGRTARFLAKSTLFEDPKVAWLVRASGAIPVYRQQDAVADSDAASPQPAPGRAAGRAASNAAMFRAAEQALQQGDAIALFPEGISHMRPSLAPLKTGAARLALGAARRIGGTFPLVPVGITLDDRAIFRSTGLLVVGPAVAWDDLAVAVTPAPSADRDAEGEDLDPALVRALTARIDEALRAVTAGYVSWEDARLVAAAERIHTAAVEAARLALPGAVLPATLPAAPTPATRLTRYHFGAALLARVAAAEGGTGAQARTTLRELARDVRNHERLLGVLDLVPGDLAVPTDLRTAFGWARRRLYLALVAALAAVGAVLGWIPYRLTGIIAERMADPDERDVLATAKTLVGGVCFLLWTVLLALVAAEAVAGWVGLVVLLVVPPLLVLTLVVGERGQLAWQDARRFVVLRRRKETIVELRERQAALAGRIVEVGREIEEGRGRGQGSQEAV